MSVELVTNGTSWARPVSGLSSVAIAFVGVVTATVAVDVVSV